MSVVFRARLKVTLRVRCVPLLNSSCKIGVTASPGSVISTESSRKERLADVFLVPAGDNADEARRYAGNLRVIAVDTFQQALDELATLPPK